MTAIDVDAPTVRTELPRRSASPLTDAVIKIGVAVVLGWAAVVGGAVMIVVGYLRVHSADSLAQQFAYFSSACIGGLALIGIGGLAVLSRQHADARRAVEEIRRRSHLDATARQGEVSQGSDGGAARTVTVAPGGNTYHRADCVFVAGRTGARQQRLSTADARTMRPCQVCQPAQP